MQGAYEAYCVTFFWKYFSPEKELAEACTLAEPTKSDGVRLVIWSTLEESRQWVLLFNNRVFTLMCKYKVSSFDAKGEGNYFSIALGVTTAFLLTSFYWENFIRFGMSPKPGPDCHLAITFSMGDGQLFGMVAEDTGWCSLDIFKQRTALIGNTVGITDEQPTSQGMAAGLSKALGFPVADDLGNMFLTQRNFVDDSLKACSVEFSRQLNLDLQSLDTWLAIHARKIPMETQAA